MALSIPVFARDAVSGLVSHLRPAHARPAPLPSAPPVPDAVVVPTREVGAIAGGTLCQLVWAPVQADAQAVPFPTLSAIDAARDPMLPALATAPNAAALEARARALADRSWSEMVWLTGMVDQARFSELCAALDRERAADIPHVPFSQQQAAAD